MQTIRTDFASKVGIIFEIYNMFHNTKRENQPYNWLVFSVFLLSREWVLNHIFKSIYLNTKETK